MSVFLQENLIYSGKDPAPGRRGQREEKQLKRNRAYIAVLLAAALVLGLAGCGSFEARMARAARKMEKLQSYRMDMDMNMGIRMSMLGQSTDLDLEMKGSADVNSSPMRVKTNLTMEMLGESVNTLSYTEKTEEGFVSYGSADGGVTWGKKTIKAGEKAAAAQTTDFALLYRLTSGFENAGTETVRDWECSKFIGIVEGGDILEMVRMSGALDSLSSSLGIELDGIEAGELGGIPTELFIDNKSGRIVKYTMDMTELMGALMPLMLDQMLAAVARESGVGAADLSALGLSLDITQAFMSIELYDFDEVGVIEIPAAAREAKEVSAAAQEAEKTPAA